MQKIADRKLFNQYLNSIYSWTETNFQPEKQTGPIVVVARVTDTVMADKWTLDFCVPDSFDDNRYDSLEALGQTYGRTQAKVMAVYLITEAWIVTLTEAEYKKRQQASWIPPSQDPNRKEILSVSGMTIDFHVNMKLAIIKRHPNNTVELQPHEIASEAHESPLLEAFFKGYALSYLATPPNSRLN